MHTAKCEWCGKEVRFLRPKKDWPKDWIKSGKSRWGKKYERSGMGWWCPDDNDKIAFYHMPEAAQRALGKYVERADWIAKDNGY